MSFALYRGKKWLGSLATIAGYGGMIEAVDAFNCGAGKGKIPALSHMIESGASDDPQQIVEDISTLLAANKHLRKDVAATFQNMERLLKGVSGSIMVGES
ncbi:MAG TPA: hypothetical protein VGX94_19365 [Terriglobia bacterium]|nr:hypothetical protein [Terriglobia bacterium]